MRNLLIVIALAVGTAPVAADFQENTQTKGHFTVHSQCNINSPAPNAVFHTGGNPTIQITFRSSEHTVTITPDGNNPSTIFSRSYKFESGISTDIIGLEANWVTIPAQSTTAVEDEEYGWVDYRDVSPGGRTANAWSRATNLSTSEMFGVTDSHSYSVVNP